MQAASVSRTTSNSVFTGLTYINTLVTGATQQGLYSVTVPGATLSTTTIASLQASGYSVVPRYNSFDIDTKNPPPPQSYVISW